MMLRRLTALTALIIITIPAIGNAQGLPTAADGTPVLPTVGTSLGYGDWIKVLFGRSLSSVIYENAGNEVDGAMEQLGLDHYAQSGTYYITIIFKVAGRPFPLHVAIDKKINEKFKAAFRRNFDKGLLPTVGTDENIDLTAADIQAFTHVFPDFGYQASRGNVAVFGGSMGGNRTGTVTISDCPGGNCAPDEEEIW